MLARVRQSLYDRAAADPDVPYFGHLRLHETVQGDPTGRDPARTSERDVLIGARPSSTPSISCGSS